jgi:hypothetical protein
MRSTRKITKEWREAVLAKMSEKNCSRADLARQLGVSRTAVNDVLSDTSYLVPKINEALGIDETALVGRSPAETIAADAVTDDDIREAIAWLQTDLGVLEAALRITKGPLAPMLRKGAADAINARCPTEILYARSSKTGGAL